MSLQNDRLRLDPRYDKQVSAGRPKGICAFDNFPSREPKRYPGVIVTHLSQPPCHGGDNDLRSIPCAEQSVPKSELVVPSPVFREEPMQNLADELQDVVMRAAGPIDPGMNIKAQINRACDNLGYPRGYWRVVKAWHGYAGNWNAKAVFDLLDRYNRFERKQRDHNRDLHPNHGKPAPIVNARRHG